MNLEFSRNGFVVAFGRLEAPPLQRVESTIGDLGVDLTRQEFRPLNGTVRVNRKFEPETYLFSDRTMQPGIRFLHDPRRNIVVLVAVAVSFQEA